MAIDEIFRVESDVLKFLRLAYVSPGLGDASAPRPALAANQPPLHPSWPTMNSLATIFTFTSMWLGDFADVEPAAAGALAVIVLARVLQ